tara:strand:+ start:127 stop:627 length:501 start_codon:yes stop_codon:yes gene_type:complete
MILAILSSSTQDTMTTATFSEFCATAEAREQIAANALKYTQMLCEALEQDFVETSIKRAQFLMPSSDNPKYWEERIAEYKAGKDVYKFSIVTGRKYHKIVQTCSDGSKSVHAFVDKNTGELYKAASWKAPAKDVRFDLRIIKEREFVLENCDWAGGYLYKNAYYEG